MIEQGASSSDDLHFYIVGKGTFDIHRKETPTSPSQLVPQHGQSAASAVPQLAPCASSARAWRLRAARHSQSEAQATGRAATAPGAQASRLQRTFVDVTAFDHVG